MSCQYLSHYENLDQIYNAADSKKTFKEMIDVWNLKCVNVNIEFE